MNKTPSILVDTGFEVDANGVLTEIVTPNVVATLNAPTKVTFLGETINYVPSTAAALQEFEAPNVTDITASNGVLFADYTALTTVSFAKLASVSISSNERSVLKGCTALVTLSLPLLSTISVGNTSWSGFLWGCQSLVNLTLPCLTSTTGTSSNSGAFRACTGLQNVQLGSEGHAVTALSSYTFSSCTQSGLTITIYTSGGAAISGSPWGATNATIVYEEA